MRGFTLRLIFILYSVKLFATQPHYIDGVHQDNVKESVENLADHSCDDLKKLFGVYYGRKEPTLYQENVALESELRNEVQRQVLAITLF